MGGGRIMARSMRSGDKRRPDKPEGWFGTGLLQQAYDIFKGRKESIKKHVEGDKKKKPKRNKK